MLHYFHIIFYFGNTWLYITTTFITFPFKHSAFNNKFSAFFFTLFNCIQIMLHRIFIDQWAHMIFFFQWIADLNCLYAFTSFFLKTIINIFMNDQSSCGGATLAGRTHCAKYSYRSKQYPDQHLLK